MLLFIACSAENGIPRKYLDDCEKVLDEIMR